MVLADFKLILLMSLIIVIFVTNSRGVPGRFAIIDNFVESAFLKIILIPKKFSKQKQFMPLKLDPDLNFYWHVKPFHKLFFRQ